MDKGISAPLNLRHAFVAMLFAFAISRVGESTILVINYIVSIKKVDEVIVASFLHIALAIIVITTSWIGWSRSFWKSGEILESPFQKSYILLLIDVILVINYYSLALSVDVEEVINNISAFEELVAILLMFILYLSWELVRLCGKSYDDKINAFKKNFKAIFVSLGLTTVLFSIFFISESQSLVFVIGIDIALISVVILFRALKLKESGKLIKFSLEHNAFIISYLIGFLIALVGITV